MVMSLSSRFLGSKAWPAYQVDLEKLVPLAPTEVFKAMLDAALSNLL